MVQRAAPHDARPPGPTPIQSTALRRAASVGMIILLYTAATPFRPAAWIAPGSAGALLLDRLVGGAALLAALYFQWRIAGQTAPVAICVPLRAPAGGGGSGGGGGRTRISNGSISVSAGAGAGGDLVWIYRPGDYWAYVGAEAALLAVAELSGMEGLRRLLVSAVVLALWAVGWFVTPERVKREGWEYLKRVWFWVAVDEVMRAGSRGAGRRRRW